jgi:maleamate amidohydrolase
LLALTEDEPASQIVPELAPHAGEHVVRKTKASAFFATDLADWLAHRDVDTVVVAGCTTSGCVRASVVDCVSLNFRPMVVVDCVADRAEGPHEANLFDMAQKYADLLTCDEALAALRNCKIV